jgi:hypothetical protein
LNTNWTTFSPNRSSRLSHWYLNLVYACRRCNAVKRDHPIQDPFALLHSGALSTLPDGSLQTSDAAVRRLIRQLDLDAPRLRAWRVMWMRIVDLAKTHERSLYSQLVGFPDDLPDVRRLRPPANGRKAGRDECWLARRERGELPDAY